MAIELHVRQGVLSKALTAFVINPQGHVPASECLPVMDCRTGTRIIRVGGPCNSGSHD